MLLFLSRSFPDTLYKVFLLQVQLQQTKSSPHVIKWLLSIVL